MTQNFTFATVIVTDAYREQAQADLGAGFFNAGLSADGHEPATHWMSSGPWDNAELGRVCDSGPDAVEWPYRVNFGRNWQAFISACGLAVAQPDGVAGDVWPTNEHGAMDN